MKLFRPIFSWTFNAILAGCLLMGSVITVTFAAPIQTFTPISALVIPNLDVLRQQIKNYYGDPLGTGTFAQDSYYAKEAKLVAAAGTVWLKLRANAHGSGIKAIVLDIEDTTLATWNYQIFSNWDFNVTTNANYINNQLFPAVPGMVDMVNKAKALGYAIIYISGRPPSQEAATLGNLTSDGIGVDAGYPAPTTLNSGEDGLFTKPPVAGYPPYLQTACASNPNGTCSTPQYKAATRAYIQSLGYDIVANFGDQLSDFEGGHQDAVFKLPNPNYYLP